MIRRAAVLLAGTALLGVGGCAAHPTLPQSRPVPSTHTITPSPLAKGTPLPRVLPRSVPVRVAIPSIGVNSTLMRLGMKRDGKLSVPPNGFPAGWFTGAPTPGERGPAVIAGHVHWAGRDGVFARLGEVKPGDKVGVTRADDSVALFRVVQVKHYPKKKFPSAAVYGNISHGGLRLITCGGFSETSDSYEDNVVVFADLVTGA